ncbi:unnamed protein product [Rotaria sp. Silwood1]|nr:unnamed protein product [Rotaria sp. Silwood1]CAF3476572.1 unnamed protein product [Rotaria sp. Silwood1]CAF4663523.1 unnamed protein product [Rotaria sp. Silwood1]
MKVSITYPFKSEIRNQYQLIYLPELVQDESNLRVATRQHYSNVIIVGNHSVGSSSLSHIDLNKAKQLNINVLNTLNVDSRFVAEYMIEQLYLSNTGISSIIEIIGSCTIGSRIATRLKTAKHKVNIYSLSLINLDECTREKTRRRKGIASTDINVSLTAEQAISNATHVIIAIDADKVTNEKEKLLKEIFQLIPNGARTVSVTEFCVFAQGAFEILIERLRQGQIRARLDPYAFDLSIIKGHLTALEAVSAAMKGSGCGEAMNQATLVVLANLAFKQTFKSPLAFSINSLEKIENITIIGAGIMSLVTGFFRSESGYYVTIIDEHNRPNPENEINQKEISCHSTTLDECDVRHASIIETIRGIQLWKDRFRLYSQITGNTVTNRRIIQLCSSFQTKYHKTEDNLQKLTYSQVFERIPGLVLKDGDAGGIEVPGFTINYQQLCANIIQFLETKKNVKFK